MEPCKIAYITTVDQSILYLLLNQIKSLQGDGYEVIAISSAGPKVEEIEQAGIRHVAVQMGRRITPFADLVALWDLVRVLRREDCAIVHTHTPKAGLLGQIAARLSGVPVVVHSLHGFYLHERMSPSAKWAYLSVERFAAMFSSAILSVNHEDVKTAVDRRVCPARKIKHVGGGIDVRHFDRRNVSIAEVDQLRKRLGMAENALVVGYVGRLAGRRKGFLDFLAAAKLVRERMRDVKFLIIGTADRGKPDAVEPSAAEEYGVAESCIFAGEIAVAKLPGWYALMHLVVLPSLFEGLPRVLMEAAAMSLPSVASDVKGNREAVMHGENGMLFPLGDVQAMADAITCILENPELAKKMGEAGRSIAVKNFDEQIIFSRIKNEYRRLIDMKSKKGDGSQHGMG